MTPSEEQELRESIAQDLLSMDGMNLGINLNRNQAVNVVRRGLRPEDTRRGTTQDQRYRLY